MSKIFSMPLRLDGMTAREIEMLIRERRALLARRAAVVYGETHSLRKTAQQLKVSHETIRKLLAEAVTKDVP